MPPELIYALVCERHDKHVDRDSSDGVALCLLVREASLLRSPVILRASRCKLDWIRKRL
jgi:hypothetical protein